MTKWIVAQDCLYNGWISEGDINGDLILYDSELQATKAMNEMLVNKNIGKLESGYFVVEKEHYDEFRKSVWG